MPFEAIPEPLSGVLQNVLHANLFNASWRNDLMNWLEANPDRAALVRRQFARAALTDTVDPVEFLRLSGHSASADNPPSKWFVEHYTHYYGRAPRPGDFA